MFAYWLTIILRFLSPDPSFLMMAVEAGAKSLLVFFIFGLALRVVAYL
jgi:hypothetical protein